MNSHEPWRYHALPTSESQGTEWLMTCPNGSCGQFGSSPTSVGINAHGEEQANAKSLMGGGEVWWKTKEPWQNGGKTMENWNVNHGNMMIDGGWMVD